jgi:4-amino-4-deoxy-L-arabinose transferase-like glycosyltransferase
MTQANTEEPSRERTPPGAALVLYLTVLLFAAAVYLGCIVSPPSLMDDVDAVQAQIARNMLTTGDFVTARLDGVPYLEKAPLIYWLIAGSYKIFGVHDWAARIPVALAAMALCWLTAAFGRWAFGIRAGLGAGLALATCAGLFLFTRIQIPDVIQTFTTALALWAWMRALEDQERHPRFWAFLLAASIGVGLLLKSLIAVVFPAGAGAAYMLSTGRLFSRAAWKRLRPWSGLLVIALIAGPWHVLAILRNPPYIDFTLRSVPGQYHGFFWFFFINEQLLRFLNLRYPHDYNTVPRLYFWLLHLVWLFPWSVYLPAAARLSYRPDGRAGRTRLLALCWIGWVLVFFSFSTTQEYYSMPCYPAFALLLGSAMAAGRWVRPATRLLAGMAALGGIAALILWFVVRSAPTPGDISLALSSHPSAYTLSLGHIEDLTLPALAYLRAPLVFAGAALLIGAAGMWRANETRAFLAAAVMMTLFFQAARMALVVFDPYLSSRPLAEALQRAPAGRLIVDRHYYYFSSVFFYANRSALLLNGRFNNLVYGSYAPGAPDVFIDDDQWKVLWLSPARYYLAASQSALPRLEGLVSRDRLVTVASSGGKALLTNLPD